MTTGGRDYNPASNIICLIVPFLQKTVQRAIPCLIVPFLQKLTDGQYHLFNSAVSPENCPTGNTMFNTFVSQETDRRAIPYLIVLFPQKTVDYYKLELHSSRQYYRLYSSVSTENHRLLKVRNEFQCVSSYKALFLQSIMPTSHFCLSEHYLEWPVGIIVQLYTDKQTKEVVCPSSSSLSNALLFRHLPLSIYVVSVGNLQVLPSVTFWSVLRLTRLLQLCSMFTLSLHSHPSGRQHCHGL